MSSVEPNPINPIESSSSSNKREFAAIEEKIKAWNSYPPDSPQDQLADKIISFIDQHAFTSVANLESYLKNQVLGPSIYTTEFGPGMNEKELQELLSAIDPSWKAPTFTELDQAYQDAYKYMESLVPTPAGVDFFSQILLQKMGEAIVEGQSKQDFFDKMSKDFTANGAEYLTIFEGLAEDRATLAEIQKITGSPLF